MSETPFVCNLFALTPEQRARHASLVNQLAELVQSTEALPDGYAFRYGSDDSTWETVTEWVALERKCCPFLTFTLRLESGGALLVHLTGADGVKPFLELEIPQLTRRS